MFFCESCRNKSNWPHSLARSRGRCEICNRNVLCYDVPASRLTVAVPLKRYEGKRRKQN